MRCNSVAASDLVQLVSLAESVNIPQTRNSTVAVPSSDIS